MSDSRGKQLSTSIKPTAVEKACLALEDSPLLPLLVWALNLFGVAGVQTLTSKVANDFNTKQILSLFYELKRQLPNITPDPKSEMFMAGLNLCLNAQLETCSQRKTVYFASILSKLWIKESVDWSQAAQTLKLIRELEDVHILILREGLQLTTNAANAPLTFHVGSLRYIDSARIDLVLKDIDPMLIQLCISDLVARGLINDSFESNQAARFGSSGSPSSQPSQLKYSISDLGRWFLERIKELDQSELSPMRKD